MTQKTIQDEIERIANELGLEMTTFRQDRIKRIAMGFYKKVITREELVESVREEMGYKFTRAHEREFDLFLDRLR